MDEEQLNLINEIIGKKNYKAIERISEGSYGEIYKAVKLQTQKFYAIKLLDYKKLEKMSKSHQGLIEGLLLQKLKHPGIIGIYQSIFEGQYLYHVLQFCPNGSLFNFLLRINKSIALSQKKGQIIKYYLSQVLQSVDYLHESGIIHRDLKPQNIVLDSDLKVKIVDFGTAKPLNIEFFDKGQKIVLESIKDSYNKQGQRKSFVGSLHYISPQGITYQHSVKSDIWAFGILVYKIFHNKMPFQAPDQFMIMKKIRQEDPQIDQTLAPAIIQLIKTCLIKNPQQRPTAKMLKLYSYFKGVKFHEIFIKQNPLIDTYANEKKNISQSTLNINTAKDNNQMQILIQKKMFFGNYKPRLLAIFRQNNRLFMAYKYPDTKKVKNAFEINMNDYAKQINQQQFEVINENSKYCFKSKGKNANEIVQNINFLIRKFYNLE